MYNGLNGHCFFFFREIILKLFLKLLNQIERDLQYKSKASGHERDMTLE